MTGLVKAGALSAVTGPVGGAAAWALSHKTLILSGIAVLALGVVIEGYRHDVAYYKGQLDQANQRVANMQVAGAVNRHNITMLTGAVQTQNSSIETMVAGDAQRAAAFDNNFKQILSQRDGVSKQVAAIMGTKAPADGCTGALSLIKENAHD